MPTSVSDYQIRWLEDDYGFGHYAIYTKKKGWFRWYWKRTHLCCTLNDAKAIIEFLARNPKDGEVLWP